MIVLKIIIKKCIDEKIQNLSTPVENALSHNNIKNVIKDNWLDIEQTVFNILNNLINKRPSKISYPYIYLHCSQIFELLCSQAHQIDSYIDLEKNIIKIEDCLRSIKDETEMKIFMDSIIKMLAEVFNKINLTIISADKISLILDLIFSPILEQKEALNLSFEKLKNSIYNMKTNFFKTKDKLELDSADREENLITQKIIGQRRDNLDCFFYYITKFTNDITNGKKIWYILENQIIKRTNSEKITNRVVDLAILYILGKSRYLKNFMDENEKKKIVLSISTIIEFVSDKFFNAKIIIPVDKNEYIENHSVALFTEIICNYTDLLPYSFISSEAFIDVNLNNFNISKYFYFIKLKL